MHLSGEAQSVRDAGQIHLNDAREIEAVDNYSGHYKPTREELLKQAQDLNASNLTDPQFDVIDRSH